MILKYSYSYIIQVIRQTDYPMGLHIILKGFIVTKTTNLNEMKNGIKGVSIIPNTIFQLVDRTKH